MEGVDFSVLTRQKSDLLFSSQIPLGAFGAFVSPVRKVSGYALIAILAISDQPFAINIEEATAVNSTGEGNFVQTQAILLSQPSGAYQKVAIRFNPVGKYMKLELGNLAAEPETFLSLVGRGVPLA
jgi:hypothetical protein